MLRQNVVDKSDILPQCQHSTVFTFCNLETGSDKVLFYPRVIGLLRVFFFFSKRHEADDKSILSIFATFYLIIKQFLAIQLKKYNFFFLLIFKCSFNVNKELRGEKECLYFDVKN